MTKLRGAGIAIELPAGWDARIARRAPDPGLGAVTATAARPALLHAASFPLPPDTQDFGGNAVEVMRATDVLITLFEYGPDHVGDALFARQGLPRKLQVDDFDQNMLQHNLAGQAGCQQFFTDGGSAWCLYVVLGHHLNRVRAVPLVNQILRTITFG